MAVPWALTGLTVLLQIAYPLVHGQPRTALTVLTVLVFFAASTSHALLTRGARWTAAFLAVTVGGGLLAESVGVHTGVPFGHYAYADTLGRQLAGVPLVVPLAWAMMAYPALLVAQRLGTSPLNVAVIGGVALAAWDLFLDPMMVAAGHWRWSDPSPRLPGVPHVPLTNYAGWLLVATAMMALLAHLPARTARPHTDGPPFTCYLWVYGSSVLANAAFFGRPAVALWGGLAMGAVAIPFAARLARPRAVALG